MLQPKPGKYSALPYKFANTRDERRVDAKRRVHKGRETLFRKGYWPAPCPKSCAFQSLVGGRARADGRWRPITRICAVAHR